MIVVPVIGPDLAHGSPVAGPAVAQFLLDAGMNEDPLDFRIARRAHQQSGVRGRPDLVIDKQRILLEHRRRREVFAFSRGQGAGRHRRQPDIGIKANLMRCVSRKHRAAARLCNIADQKPGPTVLGGGLTGEFFNQRDQIRVAPAAIA